MACLPSAVILSTSGKNPLNIVKGILETDILSEPELSPIGVDYWTWNVDNKYYNASVQLAVVSHPESNLSYILDHGEALLVYCDSTQIDALSSVNSVIDMLGDFEPEVQMLICDSCDSDSSSVLSRIEAQKWCINRGWELIELVKSNRTDTDEEEDEDFPESCGFKRIRQALHAHTWSNLIMKESQGNLLGSIMNSVVPQHANYADEILYEPLDDDSEISHSAMGDINGYEDENAIDPSCVQADMLGGLVDPTTLEDCLNLASGCGNFEDLFSKFEQLKQTAAGLPTDQRKDYAEKVAVAFWKAMGGDDDEVRELDTEDRP